MTFHGCRSSRLRSEPTRNTGVISPLGSRQSEKPITSGEADATPLTARISFCMSPSSDGSSKHLVPWRMTHRSASVCSIMVVTMRPKPR